jgi:hypothetical protein
MGETMKVLSFSLYGDNPKYNIGAIKNSELHKDFFSDWEMRVYYNSTVPTSTLKQLEKNGVNIIDTKIDKDRQNSLWRFYPAGDETIDYFISRDCDSRIFERDVLSVNQWIESEKPFHIIREHPWGHTWVINAGMWGCVGGFIENIEKSIEQYLITSKWANVREVDQWFLKECIYPVVKDYSFVSDEFINFEGTSVPINRDRKLDDFAFIGEPFDENDNQEHNYRDLIKQYYNQRKL